jgi:hypothetical protein
MFTNINPAKDNAVITIQILDFKNLKVSLQKIGNLTVFS